MDCMYIYNLFIYLFNLHHIHCNEANATDTDRPPIRAASTRILWCTISRETAKHVILTQIKPFTCDGLHSVL